MNNQTSFTDAEVAGLNWNEANLDTQQAYDADLERGSGGIFRKLEDGDNRFRVLPSWRGEGHWDSGMVIFAEASWFDLPEGCGLTAGIDIAETFKKDPQVATYEDPIGAVMAQVPPSKLGRGNNRTRRNITHKVNAVIRDGDTPRNVILSLSLTVKDYIIATLKANGVHILNPVQGYDFTVAKSGSGLKTKYVPQLLVTPCPVADDIETIKAIVQPNDGESGIFDLPAMSMPDEDRMAELRTAAAWLADHYGVDPGADTDANMPPVVSPASVV